MSKGKRLFRTLTVCILLASMTISANATGLQGQEQQLENQRDEVKKEQETLAARVQVLTTSMQNAEAEISAKELEIERTEEELLQAKIEQNRQYESMKLRMQYMYENGNESYLEILIGSESIIDFFTKAEYIATMSQYDRKKLDEFTMIVHSVEEKELVLKADYERLEALRTSLAAQQQEAKKLLAEKSSELAKLNQDLSAIRNQIKKAEEGSRHPGNTGGNDGSSAQAPVVSGTGQFTHPCPGYTRISSYFNEIRNGVNDPNAHKGIDLAAPAKTPIYAADSGKVLYARWSNSAGYWVVIDHGGGLVTKYMHMYQMPYVKEGQRVQKGQHIGGVGNTGNSFGNHLHFQVEVNGRPVNPLKYL